MLKGSVIHCGVGLSEGALHKLREQLESRGNGFQEDSDLLGLVLCKKIVEQYRGSLTVESDGPTLGTTISFKMRMTSNLNDTQSLIEENKFAGDS